MQQSQTSASTFGQISNDIQNFKKREKGGKKTSEKIYYFKYYQVGILVFVIIIFIFLIGTHIILYESVVHMINQYSAFTMFKQYYGIFNNLFTSTLSLACLSKESKSNNRRCESLVTYFQRKYISHANSSEINFQVFLFSQNSGTANVITKVRQKILQALSDSNDNTIEELLNSKMVVLDIAQNITKEGNKLIAYKKSSSFIDILDHMTTGFVILNSGMEHLFEPVFIINKVNISENWNDTEKPFEHVKINGQLSQYQYYYYYALLNYHLFIQKLDAISNSLIISSSDIATSRVKIINIVITVILLVNILLQIILYIYIQSFFKIIAGLLNDIEKKMDLKNDEISVREMFLQKIEKLKIIISLYKQDIYQAIVDLNFIYDNYKKFIEEKNKEMAKYLKKEKFLNEQNYTIKNKYNKINNQYISSVNSNIIYFYYIIICSIISIIVASALFLLWSHYDKVYNRVNNLIVYHGNLTNDAYKTVNYFQLMMYSSITVEDINNYEGYDDSKGINLFSKIYQDLENLYEAKKYMNNLKQFNLDNVDSYFNFTCETYSNYLYNNVEFLKSAPSRFVGPYREYLIYICNYANAFKSNNYKQVFSLFLESMQIGINQMNDTTYEGLIRIREGEYFPKITGIFLFVFVYTLEILGMKIQRQSNEKICEIIENYIHISFVIYYITSFIFIIIIVVEYIYRFNYKYYKLHEMKKVFKICNKSE